MLLATFLLAGLGVVAGLIIGLAVGASCNPEQDLVCIDSGTAASFGALALGIGGASLGLVGSLVWLLARRVMAAVAHVRQSAD